MGRGAGRIILGSAEIAAAIALAPHTGGASLKWLPGAIGTIGLSTVLGGAASSLQKPPTGAITARDLGNQLSDQIASLPIVFGKARLGINRVAMGTTNNNRLLWIVGALCQGPISGIDAVWIDGNLAAAGATFPALNGGTPQTDYHKDLGVWLAYGTDGQAGISPKERGGQSIAASVFVDGARRRITFASSHPFIKGDMIESVSPPGVAGMTAGEGYSVIAVGLADGLGALDIMIGTPEDTRSGGNGVAGSVDYHTPQIILPGWDAAHNGRGVAWILLRLGYNANLWNSIPRITVDVTGAGAYDPRSVTTKSVTAIANGTALGPYSTSQVQNLTIPSHGFSEGALFQLSGSGTNLDGIQRVERVVDANTVAIVIAGKVGTFTSCTATLLSQTNANPILAVRQLLTNPVWGAGVPASEVDDTAITTWANHCDETVWAPVPDTATFINSRLIASTTHNSPVAGQTTVQTTGASQAYAVGGSVYFSTDVFAPELQGQVGNIVGTPTLNTFVVNIATASDWGGGGVATEVVAQQRFLLGGTVDGNNSVKQNLETVLGCCRGVLAYQGGVYSPSIRRATAVSLAFTQDDIIGDWSFDMAGQRAVANIVRATYPDPGYGWQQSQVDWPVQYDTLRKTLISNGFLAADQNQVNRADFSLPLVSNRSRAQQIIMVRRRESRVALRVGVTMKEKAIQCIVGDVITLTHETPGWTNQPFWVTMVQPLMDGTVRLSLEGYDASAYNYDANDDTPFLALTAGPGLAGVAPGAPMIEVEFDDIGEVIVAVTAAPPTTTQPTAVGFRVAVSASGPPSDATVDAATFQDFGGQSFLIVNLGGQVGPGQTAHVAVATYTSSTIGIGSRSQTTVVRATRLINVPTAQPTVYYARRSSSMAGDSALTTTVLPALGFAVTTNLSATVSDCITAGKDFVLVDCLGWAVDEHNAFVISLLAAGLRVLTTGNDSGGGTGYFPILSVSASNPEGQPLKAATPHPVQQGWSALAVDSDIGNRITAIVDYAVATLSGYASPSGSGIGAFTLNYPGGGVLYHDQSMSSIATSSGDTGQYIKNVGNFLAGRLYQTLPGGVVPAQLIMKVTRGTPSGANVPYTIAVADPRPQGSGYITVAATASGGATVSPSSAVISGSATRDVDTTASTTFTVTRGSTTGRVVFKASATGREFATDAIDVDQDPSTLSANNTFGAMSQTPDYVNNQVTLSWTWNGVSSATFNVWVADTLTATVGAYAEQGGSPYAAGTSFIIYNTLGDIESTGVHQETIGFYVEALVGGTVITSVQTVVTYHRP